MNKKDSFSGNYPGWFFRKFLHDGHPCLWLTLPTAGRIRDFHPIERALTVRTDNKPVLTFHQYGLKY
jgi:hypothetical protein